MSSRTDFFEKLRPEGPWVVSAIIPDSVIITETFTELDKLEAWIETWDGKANIYFVLNECDVSVHDKKPGKDRMLAMTHLHVDIDPDDSKPLDESRKEIKENIDKFTPKPSIIIDSGGGYQVIWKLKDKVDILRKDDITNIEELEAYNRQLTHALHGDKAAHNIDRIMRVPGTVNIPNKSKVAKGRTENRPAKLVEFNDLEYDLDSFTQASIVVSIASSEKQIDLSNLEEVDVDDLDLNTVLMDVIKNGTSAKKNFAGNRSAAVWYAACNMVKAELDNKTIASVLLNPSYQISDHVLNGSIGRTPEEYVKRQIRRARDFAIAPEMAELNKKYCVVKEGNKAKVLEEFYETELERNCIRRMSFQDFSNFYCNREIVLGVDPKTQKQFSMPIGKWWLTHANRRTYDTVTFAPNKIVPGAFNLWRGFAHAAVPGDWSMLNSHIYDNICNKNDEHYNYLMNWLARCIQKPHLPGEVAVVLRGQRGVGKGVLGDMFGKLLGQHYLQITQKGHLVGNFNQHLRDCVFCHADEAFFAGDKSHESVMKAIITEGRMMIEQKGIDAIQCKNYIHLLMCSNEKWVVPAGAMERRFFVLDVNPENIQDLTYFGNLKKQMRSGGFEAMLYDLQTRDISTFEVRKAPRTTALVEQQIRSMDIEHEWWYEKLKEGCVIPSHVFWDHPVDKEGLIDDYIRYAKDSGVRRINKNLVPFFEGVLPTRSAPLTKTTVITVKDIVLDETKQRKTTYTFPKLHDCRSAFDDILGIKTDWAKEDQSVLDLQEEPDLPF